MRCVQSTLNEQCVLLMISVIAVFVNNVPIQLHEGCNLFPLNIYFHRLIDVRYFPKAIFSKRQLPKDIFPFGNFPSLTQLQHLAT